MVAISFQKRFAPPIIAGDKRQTIRAERKRPIRPGQLLHLFTGMRTKHCRRIGVATCTAVLPIWIDFVMDTVTIFKRPMLSEMAALDTFAVRDGFRDWRDMHAFWQPKDEGVLSFHGVLIEWDTTFWPTLEEA